MLIPITLLFSLSLDECIQSSMDIEEAIRIAKDYVGKPYKVYLSASKRKNRCLYKVKGTEGYISIDAKTGEIVKLYRR